MTRITTIMLWPSSPLAGGEDTTKRERGGKDDRDDDDGDNDDGDDVEIYLLVLRGFFI
jgi:hypothetical protein